MLHNIEISGNRILSGRRNEYMGQGKSEFQFSHNEQRK